eukprot:TRINITY_DN7875_c0_g1_i3.p1 TRINITY_DN7875_c0_g1~~TRINITY_DN7875_c0_g1_i3.p1  ORF type:complete len:111 (+),score=25.52 TRINITY_DN7875_c0_g1_i3:203-535(+)
MKTHRKDFEEFDTNNDGYLTPQELKNTLPDLTSEEIEDFYKVADKNKDELIDWNEYLAAAIEIAPEIEELLKHEELIHAEATEEKPSTSEDTRTHISNLDEDQQVLKDEI